MKADERKRKEAEARQKIKKDSAFLAQKELEEHRKREEAALRAEKEAQLQAFRDAELAKIQKELKTKRFFDVNQYNRKVVAPDTPVYFGEFIELGKPKAWIPHGQGQFLLNDEVKIDGSYTNGVLNGIATINWTDGYTWTGHMKDDVMHGPGVVTDPEGVARPAMAHDNSISFYQDELLVGKQVEFQEQGQLFSVFDANRKPRATLVKHIKNWKYAVRFQADVWPLERKIDFAVISRIKVLNLLPSVYTLTKFDISQDMMRIDDHREGQYNGYRKPIVSHNDLNMAALAQTCDSPMRLPDLKHVKRDIHFGTEEGSQTNIKAAIEHGAAAGAEETNSLASASNGFGPPSLIATTIASSSAVSMSEESTSSSLQSSPSVSPNKCANNTNNKIKKNNNNNNSNSVSGTDNSVSSALEKTQYQDQGEVRKNEREVKVVKMKTKIQKKALPDKYDVLLLSKVGRSIPRPPQRQYIERLGNMFEGAASGIGAAREEERLEQQKELKKLQWAHLIEERRSKQEEERNAAIQREQQAFLDGAVAAQKEKNKKKQEEEEERVAREKEETESAIAAALEALPSMSISDHTKHDNVGPLPTAAPGALPVAESR